MPLSSLIALEVPLAYATLGFAITVIIWRSPVGLSFIPQWDNIWGDTNAPYPRREEHMEWWNLFYLVMYGGAGIIGQLAGLFISIDRNNRPPSLTSMMTTTSTTTVMVWRARMLGLFHVIIACHHIMWSVNRKWGRLEMGHLDLPLGGYGEFGIAGVLTGYHGLHLLLTTEGTIFMNVIRRKTLVDASSMMTLIEVVVFYFMLLVDYRSKSFEKAIWIITCYAPLVMFGTDFLCERRSMTTTMKTTTTTTKED